MKKLFIITALLLFAGLAFGQTLQKGSLIGVHLVKVELKTGTTMDQYIKFFNENTKPAWEKADKGMKIFPIKAIRGENINEFGMIVIYKDEAARNKHYDADGNLSEYGTKVMEEIAPVTTEAEKLGTWTSTYTDWIVL
jgi:hypothetical protein